MRLLKVIPVENALQIIRDSFSPLKAEVVDLFEAGGRYAASAIIAAENVPSFDRSTVDGYAVRAMETFGAQENLPAMLELTGEVSMGLSAPGIRRGECCFIPTGGMLPAGADAVVMMEYTEALDSLIHIFRQVAPGENLIRRGEDLHSGQEILPKGQKLRGAEIGLLASLGIIKVEVIRRPKVGILSTGDELVQPADSNLAPGQIRDSNGIALAYLAKQMGAEVLEGGILSDSYQVFLNGIGSLLEQTDMVILSGGSSVGNRDFTCQVLRELGEGPLLFEGIAIHPGKPTLLANCHGKPVLGLPGHPVSALNIFAIFGGALIRQLSGASDPIVWRPSVRARLTKNVSSLPGMTDLVQVALTLTTGGPEATPVFGRSGLLHTLAEADGLVWIPEEVDGLIAGETVDVYLWD